MLLIGLLVDRGCQVKYMFLPSCARRGIWQMVGELWPADTHTDERDAIYDQVGFWHPTSCEGLDVKTGWNYETLSVRLRKLSSHFIRCILQ